MHRTEAAELETCAGCGSEVLAIERAYAVDPDALLCFECAIQRGGVYDELHDRWTTPPAVEDLPGTTGAV